MPYSMASNLCICDNCGTTAPGTYNHRPDGWLRFLPSKETVYNGPEAESFFCSKACRDALAVTAQMDAEDRETYTVTINEQRFILTPGRLSPASIAAIQRVCAVMQDPVSGTITLSPLPAPAVPQERGNPWPR